MYLLNLRGRRWDGYTGLISRLPHYSATNPCWERRRRRSFWLTSACLAASARGPSVTLLLLSSWLISAWLEFFSPLSGEDKHKTCEEEDRWEGNTMRSGGYEYLGGGHFRASSTKLKFASEKLQYGGGAIRRVSLCDGAAAVV